MKRRKRKPGGGRKPGGEFPGKSATFTTRIQPQTLAALKEAKKATKLSVSTIAAQILNTGLAKPSGERRNLSLAAAVALLAERIERDTGRTWFDDAFTATALHFAIGHVLLHFGAGENEESDVPPAVEEIGAKAGKFGEQYRKPSEFGFLQAVKLFGQLEALTSSESPNEWDTPVFFSEKPGHLWLIGAGLMAKNERRGRKK